MSDVAFVADWVPVEYAAAFVALTNHGPTLVDLLEACERWRAAINARRAYGESVYRGSPFDICSEPFRVESARLDRAIVERQRDLLAAITDVHAVGLTLDEPASEERADPAGRRQAIAGPEAGEP